MTSNRLSWGSTPATRRLPIGPRTVLLAAALWLGTLASLHAHAGHDDAPGGENAGVAGGPISISDEARKNLGLKTEEAEVRTLDKTLLVLGQIQVIPNRAAVVSSRIAGRIIQLPVNEGDRVKKGQMVAEVESLQVGNPPPRAQYTTPIDGVVLERAVLVGASTDPNTKLLTVADLGEVYAEARVFEGQVAQVRPGQKVRVRSEGMPGEVFEGTIERISGALDPETRTLKVWARIDNHQFMLRPNMQATVTVVTAEADSVTAVPRGAVLGENGNLFVFVEGTPAEPENHKEVPADHGSTYERRAVVTGVQDDRFVEIIEGVLPGDKVVTQGNYQLQYVTAPKPATADSHQDGGAKRANDKPDDRAATRTGFFQPNTLTVGLGIALALALGACAVLVARLRRRGAAPAAANEAVVPTHPASAPPTVREDAVSSR